MLTNPNWNVHTDYAVNDVFKPDAASQLASTIPYDYVITQAMLDDWGDNASDSNGIDIARVLVKVAAGEPIPEDALPEENRKKRISVMLDCDTDSTMTLNFRNLVGSPWFAEGQGTNTLDIYLKAPFVFTGRSGPTYIHSGYKNFVAIPDTILQETLYVGVFTCNSNIPWSTGAFIYEAVQGDNVPSGASVVHTAWMTNRVPIRVADIIDASSLSGEWVIRKNYYRDASGRVVYIDTSIPDTTTYNMAMEILGNGQLPILGFFFMGSESSPEEKGYNCFIPLKYISQGCALGFEDLPGRKIYWLDHTTWSIEDTDQPIPIEYNRAHVEAIYIPGRGTGIYYNVAMYLADSGTPKIIPSAYTDTNHPENNIPAGELGRYGMYELLECYDQHWRPAFYNCEDYMIVYNPISATITRTDYFELGKLVSDSYQRRFKLRLLNNSTVTWSVHFCHTRENNSYSGDITIFTTSAIPTATSNLTVNVVAGTATVVDILLSSLVYSETGNMVYAQIVYTPTSAYTPT